MICRCEIFDTQIYAAFEISQQHKTICKSDGWSSNAKHKLLFLGNAATVVAKVEGAELRFVRVGGVMVYQVRVVWKFASH